MESLMRPIPGFEVDRRSVLKLAGLAGLGWLTPVGELLAAQENREHEPARSIILLWLAGGPSQLETFDPHPESKIAGGTRAISTASKTIQLADGYGHLAEVMDKVSVIRSLVSKEGDHERGTYLMKTGYRPDPTVEHPSIGAICCHELPEGGTEIPRHVSILPGQWPSRGGFLGGQYDAFQMGDPSSPLPDVASKVQAGRDARRVTDLEIVEKAFARGRRERVAATLHRETLSRARVLMTSEQLKAFDLTKEPASVRLEYGETPFGRACLAARRLTEVGVRCVEVTLGGWDSHVNNHETHKSRAAELDPAFAALIRDLARRGSLDRTVVLCGGEFGRSPSINPLGGRDHWPLGYSLAIAGGGLKGGLAVGETDPEGKKDPARPSTIADVHATVLTTLGISPGKENVSPVGRPIKLSEGKAIGELMG
jgi:Protein of unknown function (DUF1501)